MSNIEFRMKMVTALEAMQKSCSDMLEAVTGRNMELPQSDTEVAPARRMWKRWFNEMPDGTPASGQPVMPVYPSKPYTILPGHDAVEQIEREAYGRGHHVGRMDAVDGSTIDGVLPVIVNGFCGDGFPANPYDLYREERRNVATIPCRIHIFPGVGSDGKRVKE